jgi:hypothetical protein
MEHTDGVPLFAAPSAGSVRPAPSVTLRALVFSDRERFDGRGLPSTGVQSASQMGYQFLGCVRLFEKRGSSAIDGGTEKFADLTTCRDDYRNDDASQIKLVEEIASTQPGEIYIDDYAASLWVYIAQKCRGGSVGTGYHSFGF